MCFFFDNGYLPASHLPTITTLCSLSGLQTYNSNAYPFPGLLINVPVQWNDVPTLHFAISSKLGIESDTTTYIPLMWDPSFKSMNNTSLPPVLTVLAHPATLITL